MRPRSAARLAWSLFAVAAVMSVTSFVMVAWNGGASATGAFGPPGLIGVFGLVFGTVGGLVASRRPENPIGWIMLGIGVVSGFQEGANQYAVRGLVVDPGSLPLAAWGAWLGEWIWVPITAMIVIALFLLFPTGSLPSPRWRWVAVLGAVSVAVASVGA
ncbi:MAG TPA: hypothetical protein VHL78_03905, partial [Actinomycetota bacterium]|nr:hypothetical protein [Actinomycetota bacterium]